MKTRKHNKSKLFAMRGGSKRRRRAPRRYDDVPVDGPASQWREEPETPHAPPPHRDGVATLPELGENIEDASELYEQIQLQNELDALHAASVAAFAADNETISDNASELYEQIQLQNELDALHAASVAAFAADNETISDNSTWEWSDGHHSRSSDNDSSAWEWSDGYHSSSNDDRPSPSRSLSSLTSNSDDDRIRNRSFDNWATASGFADDESARVGHEPDPELNDNLGLDPIPIPPVVDGRSRARAWRMEGRQRHADLRRGVHRTGGKRSARRRRRRMHRRMSVKKMNT